MPEPTSRPHRKYLDHQQVATYWHSRGMTRDGLWPACMGCGHGEADWSDLERAHLVDRCRGGLDDLPNIALLCDRCHALMPSFGPGDEAAALAYVRSQPQWIDGLIAAAERLLATDPELFHTLAATAGDGGRDV